MEVTDFTAFCLWFALHIPSSTLCQCQDTKTAPSAIKLAPQSGQKPAWLVPGFSTIRGEAGTPPQGVSGLGDLAHGKGAAQGNVCTWELWQIQPRHRAPGSVPQEVDDPFLGNHLSDVTGKLTITC